MFMPLVSGLAAPPEEMDFEALQADARKAFSEQAAPFLETIVPSVTGATK
jgi:hypothetical protein